MRSLHRNFFFLDPNQIRWICRTPFFKKMGCRRLLTAPVLSYFDPFPGHHVVDIFGHLAGMVPGTLEIPCHHDVVGSPGDRLRILHHEGERLPEYRMPQRINRSKLASIATLRFSAKSNTVLTILSGPQVYIMLNFCLSIIFSSGSVAKH